jgi:glycosyltransferase involved in cell wall biosynthesis
MSALDVEALVAAATRPPRVVRAPATSEPDVSVVVRTHNRPALLHQALISLANQTFQDFEVVVVNDGEQEIDDVLERLSPYLNLRRAEHTVGRGRTAALNSGLAAAQGRWITYLDDDDVVYPTHLERLVTGVQEGQASAGYSDAMRALCWSDSERDEVVERLACASLDFDLGRLLVDNWIASVAFIHAAECLQTIGGFDETAELVEDWDFLIRLGQSYAVRHIPAITYEYRYRFGPMPEGSRSSLVKRQQVLECTQQMYDRYPTSSRELRARRRLTLAALRQDIEEVRWIEMSVADPIQQDLLITALIGRFPVSPALSRRFTGPG